jgi:D-alanyl-D-alanine carboxypeptidase
MLIAVYSITMRAVLVVTIIVVVVGNAARADEPPPTPRPLACLQKYYGVTPRLLAGAWWAELADGTRIPYDDGTHKTLDEALDHPDVEDAFARRYRSGAIRPITSPDEDPGRVRLDGAFRQAYPESGVHRAELFGRALEVHDKAAPAFRRVAARLERAATDDATLKPFLRALGGTFVKRNIAGTTRPSAHSYGVSLDLNPALAEYWRWDKAPAWHNRVPQKIVDAFEAEGFIWGGRWFHYDTMHFEYRPELLDPDCYP